MSLYGHIWAVCVLVITRLGISMRLLQKIPKVFFFTILSLWLAACGGGGGGSESDRKCDLEVESIFTAQDGSGDIYVLTHVSMDLYDEKIVARLNSTGSTDSGFEVFERTDQVLTTIAPAEDGTGDIYVGTESGLIVRLNSDGKADVGFSEVGFSEGISVYGEVLAISPASDGTGDIYVGGSFSAKLVRLNSDASVDPGFVLDAGFNENAVVIEPAMDGSGDIYVAGYQGFFIPSFMRLNSDGSIDTSFVPAAIPSHGSVPRGSVLAFAQDGSNDIFVTTGFPSGIVRLNSDGTVDFGFSTGTGFQNFGLVTIASATDGTGAVFAGGDFHLYNGDFNQDIARLNNDGSKDFNFITGSGFQDPRPPTPGFSGFPTEVTFIAPAADGTTDVFVGGDFTNYNGTTLNGLARLNDDGSLDSNFSVRLYFRGSVCSNNSLFP